MELIRGYTSVVSASVQDQFYPDRAFGPVREAGGLEGRERSVSQWSGRWVTQSDIDMGDRRVDRGEQSRYPLLHRHPDRSLLSSSRPRSAQYPVQQPPSAPPSRPTTAEAGKGGAGG